MVSISRCGGSRSVSKDRHVQQVLHEKYVAFTVPNVRGSVS
jgi:hypothetical protein